MTERILVADAARTAGPPDARPASRRGSDPPQDAFGALLDKHQARTATAEGQKKTEGSEKRPAGDTPVRDRDQAAPPNNAPQATPAKPDASDPPQQQPAVEQPETPTALAEQQTAASLVTVVTVPQAAADVKPPADAHAAPAEQAAQPAAAVAALPGEPAEQAAPAVQQQAQRQPVEADVVTAQVATPDGQPAKAANPAGEAPRSEQPVAAPAPSQASSAEPEPAKPADGRVPVPAQPQAQQAKAEAPASRAPEQAVQPAQQQPVAAEQPQQQQQQAAPQGDGQQPAPQQQSQPAPVQQQAATVQASAAPAQPAQAEPAQAAADQRFSPPVRLHQAAENVDAAIRLAAGRGVTHARMALHPAELGGIEIHLRHTQAGLVAQVVADHSAAAHVLREAGAELRRSLETQGIDLLRLDIGTANGGDRRSLGNEGTAGGDAGSSNHGAAPDAAAAEEQVTETPIRLPSGALIDVLA